VQNGRASLDVTSMPVGKNSVSAAYLGDAVNAASKSPAILETVTLAASSIALRSSSEKTSSGVAITLTATVGGLNPLGTVIFYDQHGAELGVASLVNGQCSVVVSNLPAGVEQLHAVYSGDGNNAGSSSALVTETVERAVSHVSLYMQQEGTGPGATLGLFAQVAGFNPTGQVMFYDSANTLIGTANLIGGKASLSVLNPTTPWPWATRSRTIARP
jgi:hypothetical protein